MDVAFNSWARNFTTLTCDYQNVFILIACDRKLFLGDPRLKCKSAWKHATVNLAIFCAHQSAKICCAGDINISPLRLWFRGLCALNNKKHTHARSGKSSVYHLSRRCFYCGPFPHHYLFFRGAQSYCSEIEAGRQPSGSLACANPSLQLYCGWELTVDVGWNASRQSSDKFEQSEGWKLMVTCSGEVYRDEKWSSWLFTQLNSLRM